MYGNLVTRRTSWGWGYSWVLPPLLLFTLGFAQLTDGATVVVTGLDDADDAPDKSSVAALTGDPGTDGKISLREAIIATTNDSGDNLDRIHFDATLDSMYIVLPNALPTISSNTIIDTEGQDIRIDADGVYGQGVFVFMTGATFSRIDGLWIENANTAAVFVGGNADFITIEGMTLVKNYQGVVINGSSGATNTTVKGCLIGTDGTANPGYGNTDAGIYVMDASSVVIGGFDENARNVIADNGGGIHMAISGPGQTCSNGSILNNIIGLASDGETELGNSAYGIRFQGNASGDADAMTNNRIGAPDGGNIIAGNDNENIKLVGDTVTHTKIQSNYIGTTSDGSTGVLVDNGKGILIVDGPSETQIGGTAENEGNIISGNNSHGIVFEGSSNNTIEGNLIGVAADGVTAVGNGESGIYLTISGSGGSSDSNTIGGSNDGRNYIAYNGSYGVDFWDSSGATNNNTITYNAIHSNTAGGIHFTDGTENSGLAAPSPPGSMLSYPYMTTVGGVVTGDRVQVFADLGLQGKRFVGEAVATGTTVTVAVDVAAADNYSLTATRTDSSGNTSPFSSSSSSIGAIPPTLYIDVYPGQSDPDNTTPILFKVFADEAIVGLESSDFNNDGGTAGTPTFNLIDLGDDTNFKLEVSDIPFDGTIAPQVPAGAFTDQMGTMSVNDSGPDTTDGIVAYDTTAPTVTVNSVTTNNSSPALSGTINDMTATISVLVDSEGPYGATNNMDGSWTLTAGTITPGVSVDGAYPIEVTATDGAGNSGMGTGNLVYDSTAPSASFMRTVSNLASPAVSGTINDATATVMVQVNSNTPVTATNDGTNWSLLGGALPSLAEGLHDVTLHVSDPAGNSAMFPFPDRLIIDQTPPAVGISGQRTNESSPTVEGTVTDDTMTTVSVSINSNTLMATVDNGAWEVSVPGISADGSYDIVVTATDEANNTHSETLTNGLTIDRTAPVVTVDQRTTSDTTPPLSGTVTDAKGIKGSMLPAVSVVVGGMTYTATVELNGTWTVADDVVTPLEAGTYDVKATATDETGNTGMDSTSGELIIDTDAPIVTVEQLYTNDNTPTVAGTVSEPDAMVSIEVAGNTYSAMVSGTTWSARVTVPIEPDGTYDVIATATDQANLSAVDSTTMDLILDRVAPVVAVEPLFTPSTMPIVMGTVDDNHLDTLYVSVSGVTVAAVVDGSMWSAAFSLPEGVDAIYEVEAVATDRAGNEGADETTNELVIDSTLPLVTVDRVVTSDPPAELQGTVGDGSSTSVSVAVGGFTYMAELNEMVWTATASDITGEGLYTVTAEATDSANNVGSGSNILIVDLTPPVVTVNPLRTGDTTPQVSGTVMDNLTAATVTVTINEIEYAAEVEDDLWSVEVANELADGTYDVKAVATDEALLVGMDDSSNELSINSLAPTVSLDTLVTANQSPTLTGMATGVAPIVQVSATVNGVTYMAVPAGGRWSIDIAQALPEGAYEITISATDQNENTGTQTFPGALIIDTTPPVITVDPVVINNPTPMLSGMIMDATGVSVEVEIGTQKIPATVEGAVWFVETFATLTEGTYEVIVTGVDEAGNEGADSSNNELTIDLTAPAVASISLPDDTPTNAASVSFRVVFSEPVNGVSHSDFSLLVDGEAQNGIAAKDIGGTPLPIAIAGSGNSYSVTVGTGTGDGTLGLRVDGDASVMDPAGNPLAGGFTSDTAYTIDRTPPMVQVRALTEDPTSALPIPVEFEFSEAIRRFDIAAIDVTNATPDPQVGGDGNTYIVHLTPIEEGGISIGAQSGAFTDLAGNENPDDISFTITYQVAAEGEGEGEGEVDTCIEMCPGNTTDQDGDGLTACVEACLGTSDRLTDTDGDGMPDGFENTFGLDLLRDDAHDDLDLDDLTNLEEFLENTNPADPSSPNGPFYVAPDGVDQPDAGFFGRPWRTIAYAMSQVTPDMNRRPRILLREGTYEENVALSAHVILAGERGANVLVLGQVLGAEGSALRRVTIMPAGEEPFLFVMDDVAMELRDVNFVGTPERDWTAMNIRGAGPEFSLIDRCSFMRLGIGIEIEGAIPVIRRCTFGDIPAAFGDPALPGAGIIIRDNAGKAASYGGKSIGDSTDPNSGWNDFLLSIEGFAVINERDEDLTMQSNYWGTTEPAEFERRVDGPAIIEPVLAQSSAILASSVFCTVWDSADQKRLDQAAVEMKVSSFNPVTNNTQGVYAFPALGEGQYSLLVEADGYLRGTMNVTVGSGETKSITIAMRRQGTPPIDDGNDGGCTLMAGESKSFASLRSDLFLGGLAILVMLGTARWYRDREYP